MLRFADRLLGQISDNVIVIDNVAAYVCDFVVNNNETPETLCVAPPFKDFWMEYKVPKTELGAFSGMLFIGAQFFVIEDEHARDLYDEYLAAGGTRNTFAQPKWVMSVILEDLRSTGQRVREGAYRYFIAENGDLLAQAAIADAMPLHLSKREHMEWMSVVLWPFMVAATFMHCKNVTLVDEKLPVKLVKANKKRGKKQLEQWKVLNIEPMKQVLRKAGVERVGVSKALHICRGHFKDYRQSGLFGKINGIFWWDSTVRGTSDSGIIVKSYNIDAPKEDQ